MQEIAEGLWELVVPSEEDVEAVGADAEGEDSVGVAGRGAALFVELAVEGDADEEVVAVAAVDVLDVDEPVGDGLVVVAEGAEDGAVVADGDDVVEVGVGFGCVVAIHLVGAGEGFDADLHLLLLLLLLPLSRHDDIRAERERERERERRWDENGFGMVFLWRKGTVVGIYLNR